MNTPVFEKVLELLDDWAQIDEETVVLDICCGTGVIGICLSGRAKKVIGVELVESAVEDARANAALNGLESKCEFHAGRAEVVV